VGALRLGLAPNSNSQGKGEETPWTKRMANAPFQGTGGITAPVAHCEENRMRPRKNGRSRQNMGDGDRLNGRKKIRVESEDMIQGARCLDGGEWTLGESE